ncbi:hypothetical protein ACJX0J_013588 [Zea mays]
MSLCANIIRYMWHKLDQYNENMHIYSMAKHMFFSICIITLFSCTQQNEYVFFVHSWPFLGRFSLLYNCALAANSYSFLSLRNLAYDQNLFVDNKYMCYIIEFTQMKKYPYVIQDMISMGLHYNSTFHVREKKTRVYGIAALDVKKLKDAGLCTHNAHFYLYEIKFLTSWFIWIIVMFTPFIFQHVYSIFNIYFFLIYMAKQYKEGNCQLLLDDEFMMEQQGLFAKPTTTRNS